MKRKNFKLFRFSPITMCLCKSQATCLKVVRTLIFAIFVSTGVYAQAQDNPVVTLYTTDPDNYEGTISFSISGDEEDFKSIQIDAGYGKKPASEVDEKGNVRIKGNVIKIYGKFKGINTPMERTKNAVFAENDFIEKLSFTGDDLPNAIDLSANKRLKYVSFLACGVENIDFSKFPSALRDIHLSTNNLTKVDLSKFADLETIRLLENPKLQSVDFKKNKKLKVISIARNPLIKEVDVSENKNLEMLEAYECGLSQLDLSKNDVLKNLAVYNNNIKSIKFGKTDNINILDVRNNQLNNLDVSKMPLMQSLAVISNSDLSALNVKNCPNLVFLYVDSTMISTLDVSNCPELKTLTASMTKLKQLDVSKNEKLENLSIENCQAFTNLDITKNKSLEVLIIAGNKFGFDATKKIINDLRDMTDEKPKEGILGAFMLDDPNEKNQISEASVKLAASKNWTVGARDKDGNIVDYPGIATHIDNTAIQNGIRILTSDTQIKVTNLPDGDNKKVNVYNPEGRLITSCITSENHCTFDKNILPKIFVVECCGKVAKGIAN
jgi:cell wall surface anchor family protein